MALRSAFWLQKLTPFEDKPQYFLLLVVLETHSARSQYKNHHGHPSPGLRSSCKNEMAPAPALCFL